MEVIVDVLAGINPLLGVLAALAGIIFTYLYNENTALKKDNKELRSQYTSDLKENIEAMVEINHTIRTYIECGDIKGLEQKVDGLAVAISLINHTLTSMEGRLNRLT